MSDATLGAELRPRHFRWRVDGRVGVITLDRPERKHALTFESYRDLRTSWQDRFRQSRVFEMALWMNHAVSAFDALRAARFHNLPLRRTLDLQLGGGFHRGEPQFRAALVRRF